MKRKPDKNVNIAIKTNSNLQESRNIMTNVQLIVPHAIQK